MFLVVGLAEFELKGEEERKDVTDTKEEALKVARKNMGLHGREILYWLKRHNLEGGNMKIPLYIFGILLLLICVLCYTYTPIIPWEKKVLHKFFFLPS